MARLDAFCAAHPAWVVEGCFAALLAEAAGRSTLLVFLNPGVDACLANCRARPWEPHKYATPEALAADDERVALLVRAGRRLPADEPA